MQYYEALGLKPQLALGLDDLKKRFYERSRQWHPDRFSRAEPAQQQQALDTTALLNDAFRTLRDPISRAEYFLKQNQIELSKEAPPELLEEVFELNMILDAVRDGGDPSQLTASREVFAGMLTQTDASLHALFESYDSRGDRATLREINDCLSRRRYISNLVRDVDKELSRDAHNPPRRGGETDSLGGPSPAPGPVR
ncbi:MAG: Fe-S protein assembly co-chaperone HscB [Bryobacterales bacterium]|nr:Fe-S protein assembly co-chaperone HscB [Bryobacterales bacterium]MBV9399119.1 Fe-S protein assembly co-chaperone HscB [Bryobacterales bacterium]